MEEGRESVVGQGKKLQMYGEELQNARTALPACLYLNSDFIKTITMPVVNRFIQWKRSKAT